MTSKNKIVEDSKKRMVEEKAIKPTQRRKRTSLNHNVNALNNIDQTQQRKRELVTENQYQTALNYLQENFAPETMMCRDREKLIISDFIESGLKNKGNSQTLCNYQTYLRCIRSAWSRQNSLCLRSHQQDQEERQVRKLHIQRL